MAGESQMGLAPKKSNGPSNEAKQDVMLATNMVLGSIFHKSGVDKLMGLIKGAGPNVPGALAHGLYLSIANARQQLEQNGMPLDSSIWTSKGGVVDRVVNDAAGLVASNFGDQFDSPKFKVATKNELINIMRSEEDSRKAARPAAQPDEDDMAEEPMSVAPSASGLLAPPDEVGI